MYAHPYFGPVARFVPILLSLLLIACGQAKTADTTGSDAGKDTATTTEPGLVDSPPGIPDPEPPVGPIVPKEGAIEFFFEYAKDLEEDKVRLTTTMGSFTIQLYRNVPYHHANFVFLAKQGYFENTQFHRVVKDFIIQVGNTDNPKVARKRRDIGKYLLPPDTRKGHRHHRGTISMPSSERDNPHKLASPYEFFIVVTRPGSYHLDGDYTPFGRVIEGMDVVDAINALETDQGEWPVQSVYILKAEAF